MSEDTFIIPTFKPLDQCAIENNHREFVESPNFVKQQRIERRVAFNHYVNCSKKVEVEVETQALFGNMSIGEGRGSTIEQKLINGYDGYGGVHDNLVWNVTGGYTYFTLNNKLILENTKTREQTVFADSTVQLSCIAASTDGQYLAVGEGSENAQGNSLVYLYDIEKKKLLSKLTFHQKGIQTMTFSNDSRYLVTIGVQGENSLAVWDINSGLVIQKAVMGNYATNKVVTDRHVNGSQFSFITVGNNAALSIWRLDTEQQQMTFWDVSAPENLENVNFLTADVTDFLPAPVSTYYVVVGADDGSLLMYDSSQDVRSYVDIGKRGQIVQGQVSALSVRNNSVVIAGSMGTIAHYPIIGTQVQPDDPDVVEIQNVESGVVAISMDE